MSKPVSSLGDIDLTIIANLEAAFNNDYSVTQACHYANISRDTYYRWLDIEEFASKMEQAQQMPLRKAREVVIKAVNDGDQNMAFKVLQARDPAYKAKSQVEVTPEDAKKAERYAGFLDDKDDKLQDDSSTSEADSTDGA